MLSFHTERGDSQFTNSVVEDFHKKTLAFAKAIFQYWIRTRKLDYVRDQLTTLLNLATSPFAKDDLSNLLRNALNIEQDVSLETLCKKYYLASRKKECLNRDKEIRQLHHSDLCQNAMIKIAPFLLLWCFQFITWLLEHTESKVVQIHLRTILEMDSFSSFGHPPSETFEQLLTCGWFSGFTLEVDKEKRRPTFRKYGNELTIRLSDCCNTILQNAAQKDLKVIHGEVSPAIHAQFLDIRKELYSDCITHSSAFAQLDTRSNISMHLECLLGVKAGIITQMYMYRN